MKKQNNCLIISSLMRHFRIKEYTTYNLLHFISIRLNYFVFENLIWELENNGFRFKLKTNNRATYYRNLEMYILFNR